MYIYIGISSFFFLITGNILGNSRLILQRSIFFFLFPSPSLPRSVSIRATSIRLDPIDDRRSRDFIIDMSVGLSLLTAKFHLVPGKA